MISEVDDNNTGMIKFNDFLGIYLKHKESLSDDDVKLFNNIKFHIKSSLIELCLKENWWTIIAI